MNDAAPAAAAVRARRSHSKVTDDAPSREELGSLVTAMASIADHSGLRPWRIIEMRGDARLRLGEGLAAAAGAKREKYLAKSTRAPLVLAIVVSPRPKHKVPVWEQEAVASGVAHTLGLLLHEAGWGTFWRTGALTRTPEVHAAHELGDEEYLLGWIYVGGIPERDRKVKPRKPLDPDRYLTALEPIAPAAPQ